MNEKKNYRRRRSGEPSEVSDGGARPPETGEPVEVEPVEVEPGSKLHVPLQ
jgi:hypothetical protein